MVGSVIKRDASGRVLRHEGWDSVVVKEENSGKKVAAVRARQRAIGRELRRMYDEVVQEAVPNDFLDLLKKIDETKNKAGSDA